MPDRYDDQLCLSYIEGEMSPEDAARFEQTLAHDDRLRGLLEQLINDRDQLRRLPKCDAPRGLMDPISEHLERSMLLDGSGASGSPRASARGLDFGRLLTFGGLAAMIMVSTGIILYTLTDTGLNRDTAKPSASRLAQRPAEKGLAADLHSSERDDTSVPTTSPSPTLAKKNDAAAESNLTSDSTGEPMLALAETIQSAPTGSRAATYESAAPLRSEESNLDADQSSANDATAAQTLGDKSAGLENGKKPTFGNLAFEMSEVGRKTTTENKADFETDAEQSMDELTQSEAIAQPGTIEGTAGNGWPRPFGGFTVPRNQEQPLPTNRVGAIREPVGPGEFEAEAVPTAPDERPHQAPQKEAKPRPTSFDYFTPGLNDKNTVADTTTPRFANELTSDQHAKDVHAQVLTADPSLSLRQVLAWARHNQVRVVIQQSPPDRAALELTPHKMSEMRLRVAQADPLDNVDGQTKGQTPKSETTSERQDAATERSAKTATTVPAHNPVQTGTVTINCLLTAAQFDDLQGHLNATNGQTMSLVSKPDTQPTQPRRSNASVSLRNTVDVDSNLLAAAPNGKSDPVGPSAENRPSDNKTTISAQQIEASAGADLPPSKRAQSLETKAEMYATQPATPPTVKHPPDVRLSLSILRAGNTYHTSSTARTPTATASSQPIDKKPTADKSQENDLPTPEPAP